MCQKTVMAWFRKLSEICHKYHLWQFYDTIIQESWYNCKKHSEQISFRKLSIDIILTHLYHFKETYICQKSINKLSILNPFWQNDDRYLNVTDFWQIYDTIQIVFWQIFVTYSFMTNFWHTYGGINVSELCQLTVFWQNFAQNVSWKCIMMLVKKCHKTVIRDIDDRFLTVF